ncbi:hypothetical protein AB4264_18225 [Vibrio sp. 10N.261.55.B8]|uniref:hypothetical protein n=1 Tax=unclassified Vibrio TaxID=2614977 RepID=UPI00354FD7DF
MSVKQAYSFTLYHVSLNQLIRRKQYEDGIEKSRLFAVENGYKLVNTDYQQKLLNEVGEMAKEKKSVMEIEEFENSSQNSTELESYREFLSDHKGEIDRVLLIVDSKNSEVCEETLSVFSEVLNHIDIHTVVDTKTYTESAQIDELKESLDKAYEAYCLAEKERRKNFTRKL